MYTGKNATFTLYEDEGDNYNYEKGKHVEITINWDEKTQALTFDNQKGTYKNAITTYTMNIKWISGDGSDIKRKSIKYIGKKVILKK